MTLIPSIVDHNEDPLASWTTALRSARLPGIHVLSPDRSKRSKDPLHTVSLELAERSRRVPLHWVVSTLWITAKNNARPGEFWVPEYVTWGKAGVTVLLRYRVRGTGPDHPMYAQALWLAPSGPDRWWVVKLEGPLANCRRVAGWAQQHFPSLLKPSIDVADWDAHLRREVDWYFEALDDPRRGVSSGNAASNLVAYIKPSWDVLEKLPRKIKQQFLLRDRLRAFWRAHRGETAAQRFRRVVDSIFVALSDPKRTARWRLSTMVSLVITLQSVGQLPKSNFGMFPFVGKQENNDAFVKRMIADWHAWWRKSRILPRTELARALLAQHIRWLPDRQEPQYRPRDGRSRAELLHKWLRPYLPKRLADLKPYDSNAPEKIERELLQWWKDNRKRCFVQLPPWYF